MKKLRILNLLFICSSIPMSASQADFHLSPDGNDSWTGKLREANSDQSDGPFATLEKARNAVRELKAKAPKKDILVQIRGGEYQLKQTVVFGMEDSGNDSTITYEAAPKETPIFHSDLSLTGWTKLSKPLPHLPKAAHGKIWVTDVPKLKKTKPRRFYTLYDAEGLLPRARSKGFIPTKSKGSSKNKLSYPPGVMRSWPNIEDVEIVIRPHHAWIVNILPLNSELRKRIKATR